MNWRDNLAMLFGMSLPLVAGQADAMPVAETPSDGFEPPKLHRDVWVYIDPIQQKRLLLLAGHSSHSSHASHASHYSGSGGGYAPPASSDYTPAFVPPPSLAPAPVPAPPAIPGPAAVTPPLAKPAAPRPPKRLADKELSDFVTKVQLALVMRGYDVGPVNGRFEEPTKTALRRFQSENSLAATGFMDLKSLRLLGVVN